MATHSSILPAEFHGQTHLAGYSPCGCKEMHTTEVTSTFLKEESDTPIEGWDMKS